MSKIVLTLTALITMVLVISILLLLERIDKDEKFNISLYKELRETQAEIRRLKLEEGKKNGLPNDSRI